jgi:hypothetical protein
MTRRIVFSYFVTTYGFFADVPDGVYRKARKGAILEAKKVRKKRKRLWR